jgi:hypothetical protein
MYQMYRSIDTLEEKICCKAIRKQEFVHANASSENFTE